MAFNTEIQYYPWSNKDYEYINGIIKFHFSKIFKDKFDKILLLSSYYIPYVVKYTPNKLFNVEPICICTNKYVLIDKTISFVKQNFDYKYATHYNILKKLYNNDIFSNNDSFTNIIINLPTEINFSIGIIKCDLL